MEGYRTDKSREEWKVAGRIRVEKNGRLQRQISYDLCIPDHICLRSTDMLGYHSTNLNIQFLQCVLKKYNTIILHLADFYGLNWRIPGFDENKTQH